MVTTVHSCENGIEGESGMLTVVSESMSLSKVFVKVTCLYLQAFESDLEGIQLEKQFEHRVLLTWHELLESPFSLHYEDCNFVSS